MLLNKTISPLFCLVCCVMKSIWENTSYMYLHLNQYTLKHDIYLGMHTYIRFSNSYHDQIWHCISLPRVDEPRVPPADIPPSMTRQSRAGVGGGPHYRAPLITSFRAYDGQRLVNEHMIGLLYIMITLKRLTIANSGFGKDQNTYECKYSKRDLSCCRHDAVTNVTNGRNEPSHDDPSL